MNVNEWFIQLFEVYYYFSCIFIEQPIHMLIFNKYFLIKVFQKHFKLLILLNHLSHIEINGQEENSKRKDVQKDRRR